MWQRTKSNYGLQGLVLVVVAGLLSGAASEAEINAPGYKVQQLVKPSAFHGVHGLAFDAQDNLYAGSVVGQSIYRVDKNSGRVETLVGPPEGMADDLVFLPDGTIAWTAINQSTVRARKGDGPIRVLGDKLPGANSIAFRKSDGRLFMGQVFAGDGLWELDPAGVKPPRNILKDIGGLNGFDIGPDGWIYGPLWFKHQVVKINPDTGELDVINGTFGTPAAANFDSKWNLYVVDTALGTLNRVDIKTGSKKVIAQLATSLDNLAIDSKDRIFVSNMADNGIQEVNVQDGRTRQVVKGGLAMPISIAAVAEGNHDAIYVADIFAFRAVDGSTGRVTDIERSHAAGVHIEYAIAVSANDRHVFVSNSNGALLQYARSDGRFIREWKGVSGAFAAETSSDDLLTMQGSALVRVDSKGERKEIAADLGKIQALTISGGDAYLVDQASGNILRANLATGAKKTIATGLKLPQGVAVEKSGRVLTVELGKRRIVGIDPSNGAVVEVASNLPIGIFGIEQPALGVGLAVGSGAIYVTSDIENSLYKLTKQ